MRIVAGYAFLVPLCAIMAVEGANADPANPAHELLLNKSAADQAAILGKAVGNGCIGTTPFLWAWRKMVLAFGVFFAPMEKAMSCMSALMRWAPRRLWSAHG